MLKFKTFQQFFSYVLIYRVMIRLIEIILDFSIVTYGKKIIRYNSSY